MSIEIMNLRYSRPTKSYDRIVDRRTQLGNPFPMRVEKDREKACKKYRKHFYKQMIKSHRFNVVICELIEIYRLHGKLRLFCWCFPLQCHAETIKEFIEEAIDQGYDAAMSKGEK